MGCHKNSKQCEYCGRFFVPHPFAGNRQKACGSASCKRRQKSFSQKKWLEKNPGYFRGRYPQLKEWRETHPDYQRLWRKNRGEIQDSGVPKAPMKSLRLVIPEELWNREIQDVALLVRRCGCGSWVAGEAGRDTRQDGEVSSVSVTSRPS